MNAASVALSICTSRLADMLAGAHRTCSAYQARVALEVARAQLTEGRIDPGGRLPGGRDLGIATAAQTGIHKPVYWIVVTDGERDIAIRARATDGWDGDSESAAEAIRDISQRIPMSDDRLAVLAERVETLTLS